MKRWQLVLLGLLILLGLFYRGYALDTDSYWIDESYSVLAAKQIQEKGVPYFDSGESYWRSWPHTYALAGIGALFGYGHVAMRILSVLAGTALILVLYLIGKRLYDEKTALLTAALVTFSSLQIAWSRQARMYILLELAFFLAVYFYVRFLEGKQLKDLLWLLAFLVLTFALHKVGFILAIAIGLHFLLLQREEIWKHTQKAIARLKRNTLITILLGITLCLGMLFYWIATDSLVANYAAQYRYYLLGAHTLIAFFAVVGLFAEKKRFSSNALFLISFLGLFLGASFFVSTLNYRYLLIALPMLAFLAAQGIIYLTTVFKPRWYRYAAAALLILALVASGFLFLPQQSYTLEQGTPQPPFEAAHTLALQPDDILIVAHTAVAELYLRKPDYWLAISYTGHSLEREHRYDFETDQEFYTGVPGVLDAAHLAALVEAYHGYVIVDDFALARLDPARKAVIENQTLVAEHGTEYWSRAFVYRFGD